MNRLEEILRDIKRDKDNKVIKNNEKVIMVKYKDTIQFNRIKNIVNNHNRKCRIQYYTFMDKKIIYIYYDIYDSINEKLMIIYKSYIDCIAIYNKTRKTNSELLKIEIYKRDMKIEHEEEIKVYNNLLLEYIINNKKDIENIYNNLMNNIINKINCYYTWIILYMKREFKWCIIKGITNEIP